MYGGNVYEGDLWGYSYNSSVGLTHGEYHGVNSPENRIARGAEPIDYLFRILAHKRAPSLEFQRLPRARGQSKLGVGQTPREAASSHLDES